MEPDIDGVKFAGGAVMAMQRSGVAQLIEVAHDNGAYASCAGGYELAVEKVTVACLLMQKLQFYR
jgi:phosphosulfolactate synthase (CoM biosynthesis protein A)